MTLYYDHFLRTIHLSFYLPLVPYYSVRTIDPTVKLIYLFSCIYKMKISLNDLLSLLYFITDFKQILLVLTLRSHSVIMNT